ncbi:hypothetical protein MHH54_12045 [Bacillus sp. FSL K6-4563]|nr:hypothetical protein [Bacillus pumilus]EDW20698.1 hypothetical protein BAT_1663 [Bacillus pumilus ATCC 7061]MCR4353483.1 hypothetical protein [Bacillus pumilus]MCY7500770.1 hypothetical protein [Bacillus pumilus]MCY7505083.1 hypothetical protein [Bacillus pumilus]MCY7526444.1 hypothetical protein [Bacillus pumilus]
MRIVLAKEENLFKVNELIKKINLNVEEYHWVISDVTLTMVHGRNNQFHSEVRPDYTYFLFLKGEHFKKFLHDYSYSFIFAVLTALPRHVDHLNISSIPQIEDNERYWNVNYTPVIPQAVFEIGFFDSTDVIFTRDQKILSEFRKKADFISFEEYLQTP